MFSCHIYSPPFSSISGISEKDGLKDCVCVRTDGVVLAFGFCGLIFSSK